MSDSAPQNTSHVVDMKERRDAVTTARAAFSVGRTKDVKFRRTQLKNLLRMYEEHADEMIWALKKDLNMSKQEAELFEVEFLKNDLRNVLQNLSNWSKPEKRYKRAMNFFDDLAIYKEPYGVVLICGDWFFPLHTCLLPLHGAIAAGNCVVLKPAEEATACLDFLTRNLPNYLDNDSYQIIAGDFDRQKVDYIFYVGNSDGGKALHKFAALSLTPTTLILRGKNPVYLDSSANLELATRRILWGKCVNSGQTSISPGYILTTREVQEAILAFVPKIIEEWYGPDPKHSPDYCRIINQTHFENIVNLIKNKKIAYGGYSDPTTRFIHPTILIDVSPNDSIMYEDICGPVLPIINVKGIEEVISFINAREKPLCTYIFSNKKKDVEKILTLTSCGGATVNDTLMHAAAESLPIGGVGLSGFGSYKGKASFNTFTHEKSVLKKPLNLLVHKIEGLRYPPYEDYKMNLMKQVMRKRRPVPLGFLPYLFVFVLGFVVAFLVITYLY